MTKARAKAQITFEVEYYLSSNWSGDTTADQIWKQAMDNADGMARILIRRMGAPLEEKGDYTNFKGATHCVGKKITVILEDEKD